MMWNDSMGGFDLVFMVGWWVVVVTVIVWLVRKVAGQRDADSPVSARRVLDERFAAGDLSVGEYQERRRGLR